ncbi:uncharacterized protein LOC144704092 [Wolffia australiana]
MGKLLLAVLLVLGCSVLSSLACTYCPQPVPSPPPPTEEVPCPPPPPKRVPRPPSPPKRPRSPPPPKVVPSPPPPPKVVPSPPPPPPKVVPSPPPPPPKVVPSPPPPPPTPVPCPPPPPPPVARPGCPINALKLEACVDVLGGLIHIGIGGSAADRCCPLLSGLADLDAALCLCTVIRAKVLNISIILPIALELLVNDCGKHLPSDFKCPS